MFVMGEEFGVARGGPLDMERLRTRFPRGGGAHVPAEAGEQGRAAVAAVVRGGSRGPEVLLIRRAERARDPWSGHMAFPGGREDPGDPSLYHTAVRETLEEVALDLERHGRLLGPLAPLPAVARGRNVGITIAPFVFELLADTPLVISPKEVTETIWAPLDPLLRGEHRTSVPYEVGGQTIALPAFDVQGRIVWGLTYRMLDGLLSLLR
jgi:8-oxo-dGTP pyrophosphatase MutT (NUDIX family)